MKKLALSAAVGLSLAGATAQAQGLQPQMSTQDVRSQIEVEPGHVIVPILAMIFLVATASRGGSTLEVLSDSRLKTDIVPVGQTADGFTLYEFGYLHRDGRYRGVMAQDVMMTRPEAVVRGPGGFLSVNYEMLGLEMVRVD